MAEISKQALKVDNNQSFPNNNNGAITPAILRAFNVNMIDSMVDEIGYNVDSASWNVSIDNIEAFTASLQTAFVSTASFNAYTASINAYTASNNTKWNNAEVATSSLFTSVDNLNQFTASQVNTFNELNTFSASAKISIAALNQASSSLQSFTQSANVSITNLNTTTASLNSSVSQLNANTASQQISIDALNVSSASQQVSIDSLNSKTGSYATTGSNTFTGPNTFTSISASSFVSASAFVGDGSKITGITASIALPILDEGIPQGNAFSMNFTGSGIGATVVGGIAIVSVYAPDSASFNSLTASFNAYTASTDLDLAAIHQATASLQQYTASFSTASLVTTSSFNQYTQSNDQRVSSLEANSASVNISVTNLNSATASLNTSVTNLNTATASLFTSTSLSLTTASFDNGTRNLTFTKGNGTTFAVNIPDVSGSAGDFVTTASFNSYTSSNDQRVSSLETNSASVNTSITNLNASSASQQVSIDALNVYTASQSTASIVSSITQLNQATASLQSATASLFTSTSLSLTTASAAGATITFTKGDNTQFSVTVATGSFVSASYAETASLAINALDIIVDVKNTTGVQINKGTVVRIIGATGDNPLIGTASWENDSTSANTLGFVTENIANDAFGRVMTQGSLLGINTDPALGYTAGQLIYLSSSGQFTNVKPPAPFHEVRLGQVLRAQQNNGSIYVLVQNGYELEELHDVDINTGSLANNNLLAWNSSSAQWENKTVTEVGATTTASFNAYTSSNDAKVDSLIAMTGSYATTGSNSFTGIQTFVDNTNFSSLVTTSGSLMLVAKSFTSASAHLSSSFTNSVNLIFKSNNNTADTLISGSDNIFSNFSAPTAGFKRYIGGNRNVFTALTGPQISSSMQYSPPMNGNVGPCIFTIRGPVTSSSAWSIANNAVFGNVNIGNSATNHAERLLSLGLSQNVIGGTLNVIANQTQHTLLSNLTQNNINGTVTLALSSSAGVFSQNTINDGAFTFINQFSSGSLGTGQPTVQANTIGGNGNTLYLTGSQLGVGSAVAAGFYQNFVYGNTNTLYINASESRISGSNLYQYAYGTGLMGNRLIVTGSSTLADLDSFGSMFVGRWNANDGVRNKTSDVVFAVGTGISGSGNTGRKTGFLIDSGSNTFIEGTLNVSGATSLNGDLNITGSLTASLQNGYVWVGNASGITTTVATSSFGGGGAAFPYTGSAQITGSLGITGSLSSLPITLSVASSTASIDMTAGNNFVLTLPSSSTTHITTGTIIAGQTINLLIKQQVGPATGSITFAPTILFPAGLDMVATQTGSAIDLVSMISFDTTNLMAANVKNLR